jgi:hypothetical protein
MHFTLSVAVNPLHAPLMYSPALHDEVQGMQVKSDDELPAHVPDNLNPDEHEVIHFLH